MTYEILRKASHDNDCDRSNRNLIILYICKIFYGTFGGDGSIPVVVDRSAYDSGGGWKECCKE